jgi:hypothetical protein
VGQNWTPIGAENPAPIDNAREFLEEQGAHPQHGLDDPLKHRVLLNSPFLLLVGQPGLGFGGFSFQADAVRA